jgi:hypothetical protein
MLCEWSEWDHRGSLSVGWKLSVVVDGIWNDL